MHVMYDLTVGDTVGCSSSKEGLAAIGCAALHLFWLSSSLSVGIRCGAVTNTRA